MKDYYKILEIQQSIMKDRPRYNAYVKIAVRTHDDRLKELIHDRLKQQQLSLEELKNYCLTQIENQIPTWQVAAKKAGWTKA